MKKAFTLIELLIVVAIIGILAAIAVPNFLNAQIRAKVANCEADMRSLATALEMYRLDNNIYPPTPVTDANNRLLRLSKLTTPIAYMSSVPQDPFRKGINPENWDIFNPTDSTYPLWDPPTVRGKQGGQDFRYFPRLKTAREAWVLHGAGPDTDYEAAAVGYLMAYDASNGTMSSGDVYRFGP